MIVFLWTNIKRQNIYTRQQWTIFKEQNTASSLASWVENLIMRVRSGFTSPTYCTQSALNVKDSRLWLSRICAKCAKQLRLRVNKALLAVRCRLRTIPHRFPTVPIMKARDYMDLGISQQSWNIHGRHSLKHTHALFPAARGICPWKEAIQSKTPSYSRCGCTKSPREDRLSDASFLLWSPTCFPFPYHRVSAIILLLWTVVVYQLLLD